MPERPEFGVVTRPRLNRSWKALKLLIVNRTNHNAYSHVNWQDTDPAPHPPTPSPASSTPTRRPSHPALSPATLSRLPSLVHVTGPWVPRSRYPPDSPSLWQPLVSAVSKPLAPDTTPQDGLRREATFFLELLDGGQGDSGWDESAFDRVRNERREFLMGEGRVAGWGPPQVHDVHFGPLTTPTGQINYLGSNYPSVAPRVALITGFPVGPDYIWSKAHHLAGTLHPDIARTPPT